MSAMTVRADQLQEGDSLHLPSVARDMRPYAGMDMLRLSNPWEQERAGKSGARISKAIPGDSDMYVEFENFQPWVLPRELEVTVRRYK